jgi:uncharacterized RDD family membrane protein YckC
MTTPSDPGATPEQPSAAPAPSPSPEPAPATQPAPAPEPAPQPRTTPIVSWEAPTEEVGPAPGIKFAPHGSRLLAYILDTLIVTAVLIVLGIVLSILLVGVAAAGGRGNPATVGVGVLGGFAFIIVLLVVTFGYFPYFWAKSGQTPGMRPFHLYVVRDSDGGKISGAQAFVRLIGMFVSAFVVYLGYVWIFIDARRRGWHDLIAGTVVIERTAPGK